MTDESYKAWEKSIEKSKKINNVLLLDFEKWLKGKNLKPKTISVTLEILIFTSIIFCCDTILYQQKKVLWR